MHLQMLSPRLQSPVQGPLGLVTSSPLGCIILRRMIRLILRWLEARLAFLSDPLGPTRYTYLRMIRLILRWLEARLAFWSDPLGPIRYSYYSIKFAAKIWVGERTCSRPSPTNNS